MVPTHVKEKRASLKTFCKNTRSFSQFDFSDFIPWLSWIHTKDLKKRLVNVRRALDLFIDKVIDEHLAKKRNKNSKDENEVAATDMVDELVSFLDEGADHENNKSTDSLSTFKLNRDNIKGLIMVRAFYSYEIN